MSTRHPERLDEDGAEAPGGRARPGGEVPGNAGPRNGGNGGTGDGVHPPGSRGGEAPPSLPTVVLADGGDVPGLAVRHDLREVRRALLGHRLATAVLVLVALAGLSGWLGVKSTSSGATGGGVELDVRHARVSRAGLSTPLEVRVQRDGGFDEPVRVAVSAGYLAMLDVSSVSPTPAAETSRVAGPGTRSGWVVWELDPPEGDVLEVRVDGRVEPARSHGASGTVAVLDRAGEVVVEVDVRTLVLP